MDALALLHDAEQAGLKIWRDGDKLQVRGPRRLEPLVHRLGTHKPQIMAVLRQDETDDREERLAIIAEGTAADDVPEHSWVTPEHMYRLSWPAGGWAQLYKTLVDLWSAPRRDSLGTVTCYARVDATLLAFSDLIDCYRRRFLKQEEDGTRARIEAVKAVASFGIGPPSGWEP